MKNLDIDVSVVICTHNPDRSVLSRAIAALVEQTLAPDRWELVIIDNASQPSLSAEEFQFGPVAVKVIREEQLGLSISRKRGVFAAGGKYLVFVDDDNFLANDYLKNAVDIMDSLPEVGALGGRAIAESNVAIPHWFSTYADHYAVGVQALESGDVTSRRYIWGAGMVVRTLVLKTLFREGVSSHLTDRKGKELASGGDSELCRWLILMGYLLHYDERLVFTHFMHPQRLTTDYFHRLCDGHSQCQDTLRIYDALIIRPKKYSARWWKSSVANLLCTCVTFGLTSKRRGTESRVLFPFSVFDKEVRSIASTVKLLTACREALLSEN